jgi:streptogramin lyase
MRVRSVAALAVVMLVALALVACTPMHAVGEQGALARQGPDPVSSLVPSPTAGAACPYRMVQFSLPFPGEPNRIVVGGDGALWFMLYQPGQSPQTEHRLGRITPDGTIGPDAAIWFTGMSDAGGRLSRTGEVQRFELPRDGPATRGPYDPGAVVAEHIVTGPDGGIWFTVKVIGRTGWIGRIDPCTAATRTHRPEGARLPR